MFNSFLRRAGTACAVGALLLLGVPPAQAAVSPSATDAGGWLAGQLADGIIHNPNFGGFDDYGSTFDVLFALQEADTRGPAQDAIVSALRTNIKSYIFNYPSTAPTDGVWSGNTAKALIGVENAGKDGRNYGGIDLVATVEATIPTSGANTGRLMDQGIADWDNPGQTIDYSNMFYQAYGLQALADVKSARIGDVRDFLLKQQCAAGYFRLYPGDCKEDVDATAVAVRAMVAAKGDGVTGLDSALVKATAWLKKQQRPDGSFGGSVQTPDPNTNSTGLAGSALALRGDLPAARKAAAWTYRLQIRANSGAKVAKDVGAIALGPEQFEAAQTDGITDTTRAEWQRATSQAALALIYLDPNTIGTVTVLGKTPKPLVRTVTGTSTVSAPAAAVVSKGDKTSVGRAGRYLAEQLSNGDHVEVKDGGNTFVDYDLTADTALALRLLGQQGDAANRTTAFLLDKGSIDAYAHGAPYESDAAYVEALAKLIILAKTASKVDARMLNALAGELAGLQAGDGSFKDRGTYADGTNKTKRQVLAALALRMTGQADAADKAVGFLTRGQCADGGFPTQLGGSCTDGDPQATGWALQALNGITAVERVGGATLATAPDGWDEDRTAAIVSAVTMLHKVVRVDGSILGDSGASDLMATAVVAAGRQSAGLDSHATATFLAARQRKDGGLPAAVNGNKSNLAFTASAAPALARSSWLGIARTGLAAAVNLPVLPAVAPVRKHSAALVHNDNFSVPRPLAYTGMGLLGALVLAGLGWSALTLGRKEGSE